MFGEILNFSLKIIIITKSRKVHKNSEEGENNDKYSGSEVFIHVFSVCDKNVR